MNRMVILGGAESGVGAAVLDHLNLIEDYPMEDGSTHITQIISQGGGACATAVVAAKRLGMHGQMISSVGDDETGRKKPTSEQKLQKVTLFGKIVLVLGQGHFAL